MRHSLFLLSVTLLAACSLISPYTITFTNTAESVVDPENSTLDFVVSAPTLAYISGVSCEGVEPMEIYPVANKETAVSSVHKLPLNLLTDQPAGALCTITVTAYDKTTTEQSTASILLRLSGVAEAQEGEVCAGIAAIPCVEGLECVVEDPTMADASGVCSLPETIQTDVDPTEATAVEESTTVDEELPSPEDTTTPTE